MRFLWTARRSNQSILKDNNPEYSLEGLMLKPKLQYFDHLMGRADIGKDPDPGKGGRQRRRMQQRMRWLDGYHQLNGRKSEQTPGDSEGQRSLTCYSPWGHTELDMT